MKRKYTIYKPNEWVRPQRKDYRLKCCDCGLVHRFDFRLVPYGSGQEIQFRLAVDSRATEAVRRQMSTTHSRAASAAAKVLRNPRSSKRAKMAADSALTQSPRRAENHHTGDPQ